MRREAALILGGGPAGAAAAITLARAGERPLVIERQRDTGDALCGGFLSWHSLAALDRLGVQDLYGAPIDRLRLFGAKGSAAAPLPRPALGISRRQLDTALLRHAEQLGARVERGVQARSVDGTHVQLDGEQLSADQLLLASGKHDVRGVGRERIANDPALGLRVRLGPSPGLTRLVDGAIELHLFDRGYAGLVLQEDGGANLCLAVRKSRLADAGSAAALLAAIGDELPALSDRLAFLDPTKAIDAIGAVPYGWRTATTLPGLYRLGDQAGVIPSLAGEGMGIALASGIMAAESLRGGVSAEIYQRQLAARTKRPIAIARAILALSERPAGAGLMVRLMRSSPGLATLLARVTRVPH